MDKVALGRQGEIYVLQKLFENNWKLPINAEQNCEGLDWVIEKDGRKIKVQVKTCKQNRIRFQVSGRTFDYLLVTDLKDVWVIPIELLKHTERLSHALSKTKGHYELLDKENLALLGGINDCGIKFSDLDTTLPFFIRNGVKLG